MDVWNITNTSLYNSPADTDNSDAIIRQLYKYCIPIMFVFCLISIIVNIRVLLAVHWIRRPLSPTLYISLSLAAADACTSFFLGAGLIINSYLPSVYNYQTPCSLVLSIEMIRLSGIIITVIHLLALSVNHWLGILKPLHYTTMVTTKKITILTLLLWGLPLTFFTIYFQSSVTCNEDSSLRHLEFRLIFSSLLFVPLTLMVVLYTHILFMVRKQQKIWAKLSRSGSKRCKGFTKSNCQQKRTMEGNVKAIYTTLLILGSCVVGWMPAISMFLMVCKTGCLYGSEEGVPVDPIAGFFISWMINNLVILKTLANPIIYSARMIEIKEGTRRMQLATSRVCCRTHERSVSSQRPIHLGYSGSMNAGGTALCKLNVSLTTKRSIRSNYPNTLV